MKKLITILCLSSLAILQVHARNEENWKEQDALFKRCQRVTGADKHEQEFLEARNKADKEKAKKDKEERVKQKNKKKAEKKKSKAKGKSRGKN